MPQTKFPSSDTWLLLSIVYCKTGGSLRDIIATADYINHAIIKYDELNDGLARLTSAGYVKEKNKKYRATPIVIKDYKRTTTPRRTAMKEWDDLQKFLDSNEPPGIPKVKTIITQTEYDEAVKEYLNPLPAKRK